MLHAGKISSKLSVKDHTFYINVTLLFQSRWNNWQIGIDKIKL